MNTNQSESYNPEDHPRVWTEKFQEGEAKYSRRVGHEPCCVCGRPTRFTSKNYLYVFILDDTLIPWDEVSEDPDEDYGDYVGHYTIGSTCAATIDPKYVRSRDTTSEGA